MSENGAPKLFVHKPKKGQLNQAQGNASKDFSPQRAFTPVMPPPPPPPPPPSSSSSTPSPSAPAKESFIRRYKYLWPLLLTVNLAYGAYLYKRIKKQSTLEEEETVTASVSNPAHPIGENSSPSIEASAPPGSTQTSAIPEETALSSAIIITPQKAHATVSDEQQRELFKWILDEKRKVKPADAEEKKLIDADKAVLKQFIRAESIPHV